MVDYREIYSTRADAYDLLVSREDYQGNIAPALQAIRPFEGLSVVDLGAGTGRMTRILIPYVDSIIALDVSIHMLGKARENLGRLNSQNWNLIQADNRKLPVADHVIDVAIAGWTLGHFTGWYTNSWSSKIDQCLREMNRLLRPGGTIMVLETLGTGRESPQPPSDALARYYDYLQDAFGFRMTWIRSDYHFKSLDEAIYLSRFFFGEDLANKVAGDGSTTLPECTGIWWLHL
jgi:ubiquinone/menaquinone biosynthesis C-methylase UbiE